jgi:hypothetical protein
MAASFLRPSTFGKQDHKYAKDRFSGYGRPAELAALWLLDVRELHKINQLISHGSDATVMAYKESQTSAVGMVAVAVCLRVVHDIFLCVCMLITRRVENVIGLTTGILNCSWIAGLFACTGA